MDDELKAIQADLDNVLDRLAEYMRATSLCLYPSPRLKNTSDYPNHKVAPAPWILEGPATTPREDAARVVFQYACGRTPQRDVPYTNLSAAIDDTTWARWKRDQATESLTKAHGERPGRLLAAIDALRDWSQSGRQPPEAHHFRALSISASAYHHKRVEYFGQDAGLPAHPKRQVDRRGGDRVSAVLAVFSLHRQDPEAYPIGEALFERAGEPFGMSASVVKRAYYSPGMKEALQSLEKQADAIEANVKAHWSETDEN